MKTPRSIGNAGQEFVITGHVFPWIDGQPVLVMMPNIDDMFLPVFSTVAKLRVVMNRLRVPFDAIKQIDDQMGFLDSLPWRVSSGHRLRTIVDVHWTAKGMVRFVEIIRQDIH